MLFSIAVLPFFGISQLVASRETSADPTLIAGGQMPSGGGRPAGGRPSGGHPSGVRSSGGVRVTGKPGYMPPRGGSMLPGRGGYMPPYVIDYGSGGYRQPLIDYGQGNIPFEEIDLEPVINDEDLQPNESRTYQQLYFEMGMVPPTDNTTPTNPPPPSPPPPKEKKPPVIIITQPPESPKDSGTTTINVTPTTPPTKVEPPPKKYTIQDCENANYAVQYALERRTYYQTSVATTKSELEARRSELTKRLLAAQASNSDQDWKIYKTALEDYKNYSYDNVFYMMFLERALQETQVKIQAMIAARDAICGY